MTLATLRLAMASLGKPETKVAELCKELGICRQTLYWHVSTNGKARPAGSRVLARKKGPADAASWTQRPSPT